VKPRRYTEIDRILDAYGSSEAGTRSALAPRLTAHGRCAHGEAPRRKLHRSGQASRFAPFDKSRITPRLDGHASLAMTARAFGITAHDR